MDIESAVAYEWPRPSHILEASSQRVTLLPDDPQRFKGYRA